MLHPKRFFVLWFFSYLTEALLAIFTYAAIVFVSRLDLLFSASQFVSLLLLFLFAWLYHRGVSTKRMSDWLIVAGVWVGISLVLDLALVFPLLGFPVSSFWSAQAIALIFLKYVAVALSGYVVTRSRRDAAHTPYSAQEVTGRVDFLEDVKQ